MYRFTHNETSDVKMYHHFFHTTCPFFWVRAYMTSWMVSCVAIHWAPNGQQVKCVSDVSNSCPNSLVKRLNARASSNQDKKHNVQVKVKCAMWNKRIDGLTSNHSFAPLLEQEWMRVLDVEKMESPSNINLKHVSWWMSIRDAYKPRALINIRFSKKGCISLIVGERPFHATHKHD
jgi:hypothetical protein